MIRRLANFSKFLTFAYITPFFDLLARCRPISYDKVRGGAG
jgi:hypothetical protein